MRPWTGLRNSCQEQVANTATGNTSGLALMNFRYLPLHNTTIESHYYESPKRLHIDRMKLQGSSIFIYP